jgi:OOP family OmpA-OmpF porin
MFRYAIFGLLLAATGLASVRLGERGARAFEQLMIDRIERGLVVLEIDWAEVRANGLRLELRGHAPDIYARDLALEFSRATAPIAVVTDYTTVGQAPPPRRDPIWVEILRDDQGLTLTGRFWGEKMRDSMIANLTAVAPELEIHDLTGINAARPGNDWGPELQLAALAAARLPNAYVSVEPGAVQIGGSVRDEEHRNAVSLELLALAGDTVRLTFQLREPLLVAAPFAFAVVKDSSGGMRLEACVVRDDAEQAMLEAALNRLGIALEGAGCSVALGGPTGDWGKAVSVGLEALAALPSGRFRLEYHTAELAALQPANAAELETALTALAVALPPGYSLRRGLAAIEETPEPTVNEGRYWMRFNRADGQVVLSGAVAGQSARQVIRTYAAAQFSQDLLRPAMIVVGIGRDDEGQPTGWAAAALVALDALRGITDGEVELSPGRIMVKGTVAGAAEAGRLHRMIERGAPEGYVFQSALRVDLPAQVAAVTLSPPRCAVVLSASIKVETVSFAPGSAVIETSSQAALDRLGDVLRRCDSSQIEIGGHTDSQGSVGLNQRLSQARAEAVLDELIARGVPLDMLSAQGYGEEQPVASNETETGRAQNRRIEFKSLGQELKAGD